MSETVINETNAVLEKPLKFYGGYVMQMMYKKNEIVTDATVQQLLRVITDL